MTTLGMRISANDMLIENVIRGEKFNTEGLTELLEIDVDEKMIRESEDRRIQEIFNKTRIKYAIKSAIPWIFGSGGAATVLCAIAGITLNTLSMSASIMAPVGGAAIGFIGLGTGAIVGLVKCQNNDQNNAHITKLAEGQLGLYGERAIRLADKIQKIDQIKNEQVLLSSEQVKLLDRIRNHFEKILTAPNSAVNPEEDNV